MVEKLRFAGRIFRRRVSSRRFPEDSSGRVPDAGGSGEVDEGERGNRRRVGRHLALAFAQPRPQNNHQHHKKRRRRHCFRIRLSVSRRLMKSRYKTSLTSLIVSKRLKFKTYAFQDII